MKRQVRAGAVAGGWKRISAVLWPPASRVWRRRGRWGPREIGRAHEGLPVGQLGELVGGRSGLAGEADSRPELVERREARGDREVGGGIYGLQDEQGVEDVGAGVAEDEGDDSARLAGFEGRDLDVVERGEVGGEQLDHWGDSIKKRNEGGAA